MAVIGSTGDKIIGAGVSSGAESGLSVGGPVGAVVGAFVGLAAGLFAGKSAQNKADLVKQHNDARVGTTMMMGIKYLRPPDNSPPPKPGSLGYVLQQAAKQANTAVANGTAIGTVTDVSDPNYQDDGQGNAYYMGVKLVPDTSKYIMPDGSIFAHQDFPDYNVTFNSGKLLNSLGYGVTIGPLMDKGNSTDLSKIPYVYTSPNGSKLTADSIKVLYSMGITISNLSPAALLAAGIPAPSAATSANSLQASFGSFGTINPIMIIGIILLIILFIFFKRQ